ncbi:MAG: alpha/beta hydrolase [Pseudomonadota bacterium]
MPAGPRLTLRSRPVGGEPLEKIAGRLPARGRRLILLIHGFNTTEAEAAEGYAAFADLIERQAPRLAQALCPIYWPGDAAMKGGAYPWLVARAETCGAMLASWLSAHLEHRAGEVAIVAHSLGCRLALEAMTRLSAEQARQIRLFLMAAAVPVGLIANDHKFEAAIARAASADALHSRADGVLAFWFRLGQTAAPGESGLLPEAVGLNGKPGHPTWSRTAEMPGYDHGQYWAGHRMASHLAHRLGAAVAKPRPIRVSEPPRQAPLRVDPPPRADPPRRRL